MPRRPATLRAAPRRAPRPQTAPYADYLSPEVHEDYRPPDLPQMGPYTTGETDSRDVADYLQSAGYPLGDLTPSMPRQSAMSQGLDNAAIGALQQVQGYQPRNFGQGLLSGFVSGLAGGRAKDALTREQNQTRSIQSAEDMAKERRAAARGFASQLATHRWDMARDAAKATEKPERRIPNTPALQRYAAAHGIAIPSPDIAPDLPESAVMRDMPAPTGPGGVAGTTGFGSQVRTSRSGISYLDATNLPTDAGGRRAALKYANDNNIHLVDKNNADRLLNAEEVYRGLDDVEAMAGRLLPDKASGRLTKGIGNIAGAITQTNPDAAAFNSTNVLGIRAIQALAAGAGSGFRLNQAEVNLMTQRWPKLTDDKPTAVRKLEWERRFLQNKEATYFGQPQQPLPKLDGMVNPASMPEERPKAWMPPGAKPVK